MGCQTQPSNTALQVKASLPGFQPTRRGPSQPSLEACLLLPPAAVSQHLRCVLSHSFSPLSTLSCLLLLCFPSVKVHPATEKHITLLWLFPRKMSTVVPWCGDRALGQETHNKVCISHALLSHSGYSSLGSTITIMRIITSRFVWTPRHTDSQFQQPQRSCRKAPSYQVCSCSSKSWNSTEPPNF